MKYIVIIFGLIVIAGALLRAPAGQSDVHAELQQRLLEAELGSASTIHFASGSRAMVPDDTAADTLLVNLESSVPDTRWQAAKELAVRRDPRAVEAVIRAMRDPGGTIRVCVMAIIAAASDPQKRLWMVMALGELGSPLALSYLQSIGDDRKASILHAAQEAQWKIKQLSADRPVVALADVLADVARRSIDLINSFSGPADGFTEFAEI
jgi:HEAT repeat protein